MVLLILCIIASVAGIVVQLNENRRNATPAPPVKATVLKPEFNKELKEIIADLEKKSTRLKELGEEGLNLYEGIPEGLKESEKFKTLDDSNWALLGAQTEINFAIRNIKDAMI